MSSDRDTLRESDLPLNPFTQFQTWLEEARATGLVQPDAMALATAGPEGHPSVRMVLLRGLDERGFAFFTNYDSRKGRDLEANPWAALVFYWPELERQVRVEGSVEHVSPRESDGYFKSRPRGSQLSAWASPQSQVIPSREELEQRMEKYDREYQDNPVPRPPHWGGFRVVPQLVEFWQGGLDRLHDRLCYRRRFDGGWRIERLAP